MASLFAFGFLTDKKLGRLVDKLVHLGTSALRRNRMQKVGLTAVGTRLLVCRANCTVDSLYRTISERRLVPFIQEKNRVVEDMKNCYNVLSFPPSKPRSRSSSRQRRRICRR